MVGNVRFNHRHNRIGHLFRGRFKTILIEEESHLLEVAYYIVLNPVHAKMARSARDWQWTSYRATAGQTDTPPSLHAARSWRPCEVTVLNDQHNCETRPREGKILKMNTL